MAIKRKKPITASDKISITHIGADVTSGVYVFADVLEELVYFAGQKSARGILTGQAYRYPVPEDKALPKSGELDKALPDLSAAEKKVDNRPAGSGEDLDSGQPEYIEITAFKEVYPSDDAMDYAARLRHLRDFRSSDAYPVLGLVCLSAERRSLMQEDLLVQRTYLCGPKQILLLVSADRKPPRAYMLDDALECFVETGIEVVSAAGAELPFDVV